ncbi:MAG: PIG-L deacetylase family protein [Alphaproteobacteria bacterium]
MANIVVIVPHPDDESALCAGLILRAVKKSHRVAVVYLTSGKHGRTLGLVPRKGLAAARRVEAENALRALGVTNIHFLDYPDFNPRTGKKSGWPGAKKKLLSAIGKLSSGDVIVGFPPNGINGHPDHVLCATLAEEIAREQGAALLCVTTNGAAEAYMMDAASYLKSQQRRKLHLAPTHVLQLTPQEKAGKLFALSHYRTQALSVIDFIRLSQGNLFEEYYALARRAGVAERVLKGLIRPVA